MTNVETFEDGVAICMDSTSSTTLLVVRDIVQGAKLIIADPPYGNVVSDAWDRVNDDDDTFADWMIEWTNLWRTALVPAGAFYVWGGIGKPCFRPFFKYLSRVERKNEFELSTLITWAKRRGYGVQNNYLFTREELAYFVNGDAKKPHTFHVPHLDTYRGYAGYNPKYPAKDARYRRTNVWTDVTEIMRGKLHTAQKAQRVIEVPIEVHTDPGDWVIDIFGGSGTTANACRKLGRRFVIVENDESCFNETVKRLRAA